jgi:histidine triad (HIT) family protein
MKECLFCKIAKKEVPSIFIKETNNFFAILDVHPKAPGHTLIIPKKHFTTFLDLPSTLSQEMHKLIQEVASKLLDEKQGDGFNILINNLPPAGQVIPHLHIHIIPRRESDSLHTIT